MLFITVADLDAVEKTVAGAPVVKPRHQTFYGSTEIYVREPGGNTVGFAQTSRPLRPQEGPEASSQICSIVSDDFI